jgi:histidinol dehydrogenase
MMEIKRFTGDGIAELVHEMRARAAGVNAEISRAAAEIMEGVRLRGLDAVREYSLKFDGAEPYELTRADLDRAAEQCPPELYAAMERSAKNIWDYQSRLLPQSSMWSVGEGSKLGQIVRGLTRVGIYVPGGRAAYPSSVLMNAVPAKVAGVQEIIMVTPPTKNLNNAVMAAAKIAGVDRVIAVGGAQAVGALTYGAGFIPQVDKLVGPGNAFVAAAKRMAFGMLDIDMVAGPSEVLVIADETAVPEYVAADLLSQAEHDVLASAVLVTTSEKMAVGIRNEILRQTALLERREIIEQSLQNYGVIFVCNTMDDACQMANEIAPEHLEIMTRDPESLLPRIRNAGAVFLGQHSPEPLGDYMAGPSHVLPTSGTARFFSPLSVDSFLKKMSVIHYSHKDLEAIHTGIEVFAQAEGLTAHKNSIRIRFE